jgi:predicted secreted protein
MTLVTGIVVFILIWWLTLFMVLPWRARPPATPGKGHAPSAPEHPMLVRKVIITTLVSAALFLIVYLLIAYEVVSFRQSP